jgi:hypothetical protein
MIGCRSRSKTGPATPGRVAEPGRRKSPAILAPDDQPHVRRSGVAQGHRRTCVSAKHYRLHRPRPSLSDVGKIEVHIDHAAMAQVILLMTRRGAGYARVPIPFSLPRFGGAFLWPPFAGDGRRNDTLCKALHGYDR